MARAAYVVACLVLAVTALRANLLLDQADYQGTIPWLLGAVSAGLTATFTGHRLSGATDADNVV